MEFHVITPRGAELVMRVVDNQVEIVPQPTPVRSEQHSQSQLDRTAEIA